MEVFPSAPHLLQVFIAFIFIFIYFIGISSLCHLEIHLFLGGDLSLERDITARTVPAGKPLDLGNKTSFWCAGGETSAGRGTGERMETKLCSSTPRRGRI